MKKKLLHSETTFLHLFQFRYLHGVLCFLLVSTSFVMEAQVYSGTGGSIQDNGQFNYFNLSVSGLSPNNLDGTFGLEEVCIDLNHPVTQELYIYLQSPSGIMVELTAGSSSNGSNFTGTCFNNSASASVTLGTAPFSGTFRPVGYLGRVNNGQAGNGTWSLIVHDYLAFVNAGTVNSWSLKFGNNPAAAVSFSSSNLPLVTINTSGTAISDSKILVDMGITDNGVLQRNQVSDAWNNFNGKASIHERGHTSRSLEKKSYSLELRDPANADLSVSLLSMPSESDWDLIAPYQDKSLIRMPLTYDLFRKMGHYSSRNKTVELILNNEYQGVYSLVEKPKRDKNRVDISKLSATDNSFPAITGGYILKIDRSDAAGWYSLLQGNCPTNTHFYYQYVYPKDSDITVPQKNYIKTVLDSFETVMNSSYYSDPIKGYEKYIDVQSFIDFFIINELSKNVDAYRLSTFLYKDNVTKGGKIHMGPLWDYDIAWHNCDYGNAFSPMGWQYQIQDTTSPSPTWWGRLMADNNFVNKLYCRWQTLRQTTLNTNNLYTYIDSSVTALTESEPRNFTEWPVLGAYIFPNPQSQVGATYSSEVNDLKSWIWDRTAWMDANIIGSCQNIGISEKALTPIGIQTFPNPFRNNLTVTYNVPETANVKLEIVNVLGEQVQLLIDQTKNTGSYVESINTQQLSAGTYFLKLSVNEAVNYHKLLKL